MSGQASAKPATECEEPWLKKVRFGEGIDAELFDTTAQGIAGVIFQEFEESKKKLNRPTQIRRFYDEICMWSERVGDNKEGKEAKEAFDKYLPFIRMLNAKAAYAEGRKLVGRKFVALIRCVLSEVNSVKSLQHFKLFMEAFMGFYKQKDPQD
ncbi:MAG: type III-A CRISPR-associated protein Csm2 [Magnetococcales bacterium]|nr:type III-A CRISPR-associated protein Csm2 [Magnetococcales bacterium]